MRAVPTRNDLQIQRQDYGLDSMLRQFLQAFAAIAAASIRPPVLPLGSLIGFGVIIPIRHGFDFLDARMILAYAFIPMLFVASPVALGLPQVRGSVDRLYSWVAAATAFGWLVGLLFLATAIATLNYLAQPAPMQLPREGILPLFGVFCFSAVWFICASAAYLGFLFTPNTARQMLRLGFLLLLALFYIGPRTLAPRLEMELRITDPTDAAQWGAVVLALAAIGLTNALRAAVRRPQPLSTASALS
jgi:hypothetical protein